MRGIVLRAAITVGLVMGLHRYASTTVSPLEGAWELIEARYTPSDPAVAFAEWRQALAPPDSACSAPRGDTGSRRTAPETARGLLPTQTRSC
jgi:hypothetical protein